MVEAAKLDFSDKNLFVEFQANSSEFLRVLGQLETGKPLDARQQEEGAMIIKVFWYITEKIFLEYETRMQAERLKCMVEHTKLVLLDKELRSVYNELFKIHALIPEVVDRIMKTTCVPTKEDLAKDVQIKIPKE